MREYTWTFDIFGLRFGWCRFSIPGEKFISFEKGPDFWSFRIYKFEICRIW